MRTAEDSCVPVNERYMRGCSLWNVLCGKLSVWLEELRVVVFVLRECVIIDTEGDRAEVK